MDKHSPTHARRPSGFSSATSEPCVARAHQWAGYTDTFGLARCNEAAEAIIGGLHYSTRTAEMIAAQDGDEYGVYLFRTVGGRFFGVRRNYPMRDDRSHPLDVLTLDEALHWYGAMTQRSWTVADPIGDAFPGVTVAEA